MVLQSSTTTRKGKRLSGNERKKIIDINKSACGAQSRELCFIENVSETVTISGEKNTKMITTLLNLLMLDCKCKGYFHKFQFSY